MKRRDIMLLFLSATLGLVIPACKKAADTANPYNSINNNTSTVHPTGQQLDSNSITGLYTFIFAQKCAIPSCHGKSFEPDFSSVVASYNTLVYHPVIKNTSDNRFIYRVTPGDTTMSWLHERLITTDVVLGRMPRYLPPLSRNEMKHINKWIMDGAKDIDGKLPAKPNNNIQLQEIVVYNQIYQRCDTTRPSYYAPFFVPANSLLHIYFYVYDLETKVDNFLDNKAKFSTDPNDFSNAIAIQAVLDTTYHIWHMDVNSNLFPKGKQICVRYYGRDTDHANDIEFPNSNSQYYIVNHYSFYVR